MSVNRATPRPKTLGGDRRSARIDAHMSVIVEALGPEKDATLEEVRRSLADRGLFFGFGTIQRFVKRRNITPEKRVRMPRAKPTRPLSSTGPSTAFRSRLTSRRCCCPSCAPVTWSLWTISPATKGVRGMIESVGAKLEYLPPYSRDFNPIENALMRRSRVGSTPLHESFLAQCFVACVMPLRRVGRTSVGPAKTTRIEEFRLTPVFHSAQRGGAKQVEA